METGPDASVQRQLDTLTRRLAVRAPDEPDARRNHRWEAATALVLAPGPADVEVAIIERTERAGDRWSGQLALPGGRRDDGDRDLAATAARETREEVGLQLGPPVARVTEHRARVRPGIVACFAYVLDDRPTLMPAPAEVAAAWWVPLSSLTDPANATTVRHTGLRFPAIDVEGRALWGLTLMMLQHFAEATGLELANH